MLISIDHSRNNYVVHVQISRPTRQFFYLHQCFSETIAHRFTIGVPYASRKPQSMSRTFHQEQRSFARGKPHLSTKKDISMMRLWSV